MDSKSLTDPVEPLYDLRLRGACYIATGVPGRVHVHGGCWVAPLGGSTPRLMVAIPKEFEGARLVVRGGSFAVSLVSRAQRSFHDAFFAGEEVLDAASQHFYRAPSGQLVLREAVGYIDCRLEHSLDLGDFLLVIGIAANQGLLHPEQDNLTVNEIIASDDPRGRQEEKLPYQGRDFDASQLARVPVEQGRDFWQVYRRRAWGLFWLQPNAEEQAGLLSASLVQVSHAPPRFAAWLPKAYSLGPTARACLISLQTLQAMADGSKPEQGSLAEFTWRPEIFLGDATHHLLLGEVTAVGALESSQPNLLMTDPSADDSAWARDWIGPW